MEISKNNYIARFYYWMKDEYPNDICSFFWGMVSILLFLPIRLIGRVMVVSEADQYSFVGQFINFFITCLIYFVCTIIGIKLFFYEFHLLNESLLHSLVFAPILFILSVALVVGTIVLLIWGCIKVAEYKEEKESKAEYEYIPPKESNLSIWWNAIKGKYCTKITWK